MSPSPESQKIKIYTIGHSNAELEKFVGLLQYHSIEALVDVRSEPFARYADWFNRNSLERAITAEEMEYHFLGNLLGGRPDDPGVYVSDQIDYELVKKTDYFRKGVEMLIDLAMTRRTAIMCSEEDPAHCHRSLLIASVLQANGIEILHIRHDGRVMTEGEIHPQISLPLF